MEMIRAPQRALFYSGHALHTARDLSVTLNPIESPAPAHLVGGGVVVVKQFET